MRCGDVLESVLRGGLQDAACTVQGISHHKRYYDATTCFSNAEVSKAEVVCTGSRLLTVLWGSGLRGLRVSLISMLGWSPKSCFFVHVLW